MSDDEDIRQEGGHTDVKQIFKGDLYVIQNAL